MVASSEQCRRHVSGGTSAISSFSDDGVVQSVLKVLKGVDQDERAGTKPPLVSASLPHSARVEMVNTCVRLNSTQVDAG